MSVTIVKAQRATVGALALAACLSGGALACSGAAQAASGFAFGAPIAGTTRVATAVAAAEAGFPAGASSVVIVNAQSTVDGLTASYIAGLHNAPILYTDASTTPAETTAEMAKLGARSVYVVGGPQVVAQSQLERWTASGMGVTDYGGNNRYATAAVVAEAGGPQATAFVTSGDDAHFADALAVGGIAYQRHFPILFTRSGGVPSDTSAALGALHATPVVVGGSAGVSDAAMALLGASVRLAGENRSQTAEKVADWSIASAAFTRTGVALVGPHDANAADALVAAPIAGMNLVPVLFAGTPDTNAYLTTNAVNYTGRGFVFGGADAVPATAITAATSAATSASPPAPVVVIPTSSLTSLTDNGTAGTLDAGDVIRIKFSAPLSVSGSASIRLSDTDATPTVDDLVNGVNATFTVNSSTVADSTAFTGSAPGTVLTVTLTGAPTIVTGGSGPGVQTLATITRASGVWSTSGGPWDVAGSLVGASPTAAVQTVTVPVAATGGSFSITGPGGTVTGIVPGVTASTLAGNVATAEGIGNAGLVSVTGPSGSGVYTATFGTSLGPVGALSTAGALTVSAGPATSGTTTAGVTAVNDVQTVAFSATPTSGTWTLHGAWGTTSSLAYNASAGDLQSAIIAAGGPAGTSVTGTMASPGFQVTMPYVTGQSTMTVPANTLSTGSAVTATITHPTTGVAAVASVQTVTIPAAATAGTLTVHGVSFNLGAAAASMATALTTAYGYTVGVTGPVSGVYTVSFPSAQGAAPNGMAVTSALTMAGPSTSTGVSAVGVLGVSGLVVG